MSILLQLWGSELLSTLFSCMNLGHGTQRNHEQKSRRYSTEMMIVCLSWRKAPGDLGPKPLLVMTVVQKLGQD